MKQVRLKFVVVLGHLFFRFCFIGVYFWFCILFVGFFILLSWFPLFCVLVPVCSLWVSPCFYFVWFPVLWPVCPRPACLSALSALYRIICFSFIPGFVQLKYSQLFLQLFEPLVVPRLCLSPQSASGLCHVVVSVHLLRLTCGSGLYFTLRPSSFSAAQVIVSSLLYKPPLS